MSPTREDVTHLTGPLDDAVIADILATGASYAEVADAVNRISGDPEEVGKGGRALSRAAKAVYDILEADPVFAVDPRDDARR